MVKIETEIVLKAFGYKNVGKSMLLKKVKEFLTKEGYIVIQDARADNETLYVRYWWDEGMFSDLKEVEE